MPDRITQAPSPGFTNQWVNLSNAQHHKLDCITSTKLKFLMEGESLHAFNEKYVLKSDKMKEREQNPAFIFGTLAHMAVLEPERFDRTVRICDLNPSTNEYKAFKLKLATPQFSDLTQVQQAALVAKYNESLIQDVASGKRKKKPVKPDQVFEDTLKQELENSESLENSEFQEKLLQFYEPIENSDGSFVGSDFEDVFLVKSSDYAIFKGYQESVKKHMKVKVVIPDVAAEQSGIAQDPETGLWMAIRGDWMCKKRGIFFDVKTIQGRLTYKSLKYFALRYNIHIQAAHYLETANLIDPGTYKLFMFIFFSKDPPYEMALVTLTESNMEVGRKHRRRLLNLIKSCEDKKQFPTLDYNDGKNYITIDMFHYDKNW